MHGNPLHQNAAESSELLSAPRAVAETGRRLKGQRRLGRGGVARNRAARPRTASPCNEDDPTSCSARLMSAKSGEEVWEVEGTRDGEQLSYCTQSPSDCKRPRQGLVETVLDVSVDQAGSPRTQAPREFAANRWRMVRLGCRGRTSPTGPVDAPLRLTDKRHEFAHHIHVAHFLFHPR